MKKSGILKGDFFDVVKAILLSVLLSLVLVLLFAFIVKFTGINSNWVMPVNQVIKIISIFFFFLLGIKYPVKGVFKGILIGLFFLIITFLLFSAFNGGFEENSLTVYDFLTCLIAGIISGIFTVNIKNR